MVRPMDEPALILSKSARLIDRQLGGSYIFQSTAAAAAAAAAADIIVI